jgi:hypothetical protein
MFRRMAKNPKAIAAVIISPSVVISEAKISERSTVLDRWLNKTAALAPRSPTAMMTMAARLEDSVSSHWMEEE